MAEYLERPNLAEKYIKWLSRYRKSDRIKKAEFKKGLAGGRNGGGRVNLSERRSTWPPPIARFKIRPIVIRLIEIQPIEIRSIPIRPIKLLGHIWKTLFDCIMPKKNMAEF